MQWLLFDWGDTLMRDDPAQPGPMAFWPSVAALPGVATMLPALAARFFCAVASNAGDSDTQLMRLAFERVNLAHYFKHFLTSKELHAQKPDPQFYLSALQILGCAPDDACMIGNDYANDIVTAKAVGLRTILITGAKGAYPAADDIANNFKAAAKIILT